VYLGLFIFVNFWTISIHDGDYRVPGFLSKWMNGAAHHTEHHLYFTCNYGQFFTLWDRIGESYLCPGAKDAEKKDKGRKEAIQVIKGEQKEE